MSAAVRGRWVDDVAHVAGEGVAALRRGDQAAAGEAIEHLLVLDDEQRRDIRARPAIDEIDPEPDDEELGG